jgi:hypothetical protein
MHDFSSQSARMAMSPRKTPLDARATLTGRQHDADVCLRIAKGRLPPAILANPSERHWAQQLRRS